MPLKSEFGTKRILSASSRSSADPAFTVPTSEKFVPSIENCNLPLLTLVPVMAMASIALLSEVMPGFTLSAVSETEPLVTRDDTSVPVVVVESLGGVSSSASRTGVVLLRTGASLTLLTVMVKAPFIVVSSSPPLDLPPLSSTSTLNVVAPFAFAFGV